MVVGRVTRRRGKKGSVSWWRQGVVGCCLLVRSGCLKNVSGKGYLCEGARVRVGVGVEGVVGRAMEGRGGDTAVYSDIWVF
jgi:hypothetical protein